jgi:hypothetical protein
MNLDPSTITTLVVGAIVTVLTFIYRYWKPGSVVWNWLEMLFSVVGSIVVSAILGTLTGHLDFTNPVGTIQFFLTNATAIFTLTQIIYGAVQLALPANTAVVRVFKAGAK